MRLRAYVEGTLEMNTLTRSIFVGAFTESVSLPLMSTVQGDDEQVIRLVEAHGQ